MAYENLGKNYYRKDILDEDNQLTIHSHCDLTNSYHKEKFFALKVLKNNWK